jgi:cell division protease FtsH
LTKADIEEIVKTGELSWWKEKTGKSENASW